MAKRKNPSIADLYNRALALEKSGEIDAAAEAYRALLAADPSDRGGAAVRLAAMGRGAAPTRASEAYVATLFDQHAESFEDILVDSLGYAVPLQLREMLPAGRRFAHALDLGCGTGLVGAAIRDRVDAITGVDISEKMVEVAFDKETYDELYVGDAAEFAAEFEPETPFDLVIAADVLPYLGDVAPLFAGAASQLAPGGVFAFSTELCDPQDAPEGWRVGPHQRFHHSEAYIRAALSAAGFGEPDAQVVNIRDEQGAASPGHLMAAIRL